MTEATPQFPKSVASALVAVQSSIDKLAKGDRNDFAKYDFTGVDAFYEAIGPKLAEAKLTVISDCVASEVREAGSKRDRDGNVVKVLYQLYERWAFYFVAESGDVAGPFHRNVTVPAEGAQAHGSSESYATKQFLRGQFKIPTGDKDDPDAQEAEAHGARQSKASGSKPARQQKRPAHMEPRAFALAGEGEEVTNDHLKEFGTKLANAMKGSQSADEVSQWLELNENSIKLLQSASEKAYDHIQATAKSMKEGFGDV